MKTMLLFTILFLTGSIHLTAGTKTPNENTSCFLCGIPHHLTAGNQTANSATLNWDAVGGATQYTVEVEDFLVSPSIFHVDTTLGGTSFQVNGLQAGMTYKFKVRATCGSEDSFWSEWKLFNPATGSGGTGDSTCTIPVMLASTVTETSARLSWNKVGSATQYYVEVEDEQNVLSNFHLETTAPDTFYNLTGLQAGVLYKFKVSTHCNSGQSGWSDWQFFNGNSDSTGNGGNIGCNPPIVLQATGMTAISAELIWYPAPGAISYVVEVELYEPGVSPWQMTQVVTTNAFHLTGLHVDTRYKFKVRTNCIGGGNSSWSQWGKFKTTVSPFTPNIGISVSVNNNPALTDRDGSPAASAPAFDFSVWPNPVQTSATVQLRNLSAASATLHLFNLAGHLLQERQIQPENGAWEETFSFGDLPEGLYLLQLQNGPRVITTKLVVQH